MIAFKKVLGSVLLRRLLLGSGSMLIAFKKVRC